MSVQRLNATIAPLHEWMAAKDGPPRRQWPRQRRPLSLAHRASARLRVAWVGFISTGLEPGGVGASFKFGRQKRSSRLLKLASGQSWHKANRFCAGFKHFCEPQLKMN
jgi:hypothetical protein